MIFSNIMHQKTYAFLDKKILTCFQFIEENDLAEFTVGKHILSGDELFVNIVEYETTTKEERFWEAHKEYIDLHYIIRGEETIACCLKENFEDVSYKPETDFVSFHSQRYIPISLCENDFLICYPEDGHMTALATKGKRKIKKAIFKIKL